MLRLKFIRNLRILKPPLAIRVCTHDLRHDSSLYLRHKQKDDVSLNLNRDDVSLNLNRKIEKKNRDVIT